MKYGIISDIHSNYEALKAVLNNMDTVDEIICLGDIVGYGPKPNECITELKKLTKLIVVGNHDLASIGWKDIRWFNEYAREAVLWTYKELTPKNKEYISLLPEVLLKDEFIIVHGSLYDFTDEYIMTGAEAKKSFELMETKTILFVGHTHSSCAFFRRGREPIQNLRLIDGDIINLEEGVHVIINVGSVGQPRDGDHRASFGIFDTEKRIVTIKKVPYNIKKTQEQMAELGLPKYLISRLSVGR
jgi:predicted phosphodiesterase